MRDPDTVTVLVCAWGEPGQLLLALDRVDFSHGICPICLERLLTETKGLNMSKRKSPEWVKLMLEGSWKATHEGSYWTVLRRSVNSHRQEIRHFVGGDGLTGWRATSEVDKPCDLCASPITFDQFGTLDEVLEWCNHIAGV
jgi:hypothetical protein